MKRSAYLRNLVIMAMADGALAENELALLSDRCVELDISEEELQSAFKFALSEEASLELPTTGLEQEEVLTDLIRMMAADGQMQETEKRLFALAAAKMNFPTERLEALIDKVVKSETFE